MLPMRMLCRHYLEWRNMLTSVLLFSFVSFQSLRRRENQLISPDGCSTMPLTWLANLVCCVANLTIGFGKKFGFIEAGKDIGWIGMIEDILFFLSWTGQVPYIKPILDKLAKYLPGGRELGDKLSRFTDFSGQCVEERMRAGIDPGRKDVLYYFTERQQKNPDLMRPLDVHIEANSVVYLPISRS
jgi:hypothetical protein